MINKALYIFLILLNFGNLKSQEGFKIESKLGYNFFINNGNFSNFKGLIDCGTYTNGIGNGINYEIGTSFKLNDQVNISLNLNFIKANLNLNHNNVFLSRDLINNNVITTTAITNLDSKIDFINIIPKLRYKIPQLFIKSELFFSFEPFIMIPLNGSFQQSETIESPSNAVFIDNNGLKTQSRIITSSDFQTLQNVYGIGFGERCKLENRLF
ncbi:MAG: hypothetical protein NTW25_11700 [Candidatus Kapabacteria bacterium]|nr:hypothetical protein [Candidatus Kapabacteria bacterium]